MEMKDFTTRALEEFEEEFACDSNGGCVSRESNEDGQTDYDDVKQFLQEKLEEQQQEISLCPDCSSMTKKVCAKCYKEKLEEQKEDMAHKTEDGYCCACDYDIACFEEKLESQKKIHFEEIKRLQKGYEQTKDEIKSEERRDWVRKIKKYLKDKNLEEPTVSMQIIRERFVSDVLSILEGTL